MVARKIVQLPSTSLPGLGNASTASTGSLVSGSRNEVWLCQAYSSEGQALILYVKPALPLRSILVEALSAQIGQALRLPCPDAYLVTVNPLHVGKKKGKPIVAFGSAQAGTRGLARPVKDIEVLLQALKRIGVTEMACVFDEWIANSVRGPGDVLIDPEVGAVLIDHEGAMEPHMAPDEAITNWLAARVIERTDVRKRAELLKVLKARAAAVHRAQLSEVPSAVQFAQDGVLIYTALLQFLKDRLAHLDRLLSTRVMPEQGYLFNHEPTDEADRATDV